MGSDLSVPLGTYVLAYNTTGETHNVGDQLYGGDLYSSYVPGSYPYGMSVNPTFQNSFEQTHLFECQGYSPGTTYKSLFGEETKTATTTLWQRIA